LRKSVFILIVLRQPEISEKENQDEAIPKNEKYRFLRLGKKLLLLL